MREEFEKWLRIEHKVTMPELAYKFNPALFEGYQAGYLAATAEAEKYRKALQKIAKQKYVRVEGFEGFVGNLAEIEIAEQALQK